MQGFYNLLDKKKYENITIQDIIDEADIGRSTFYAHFETKDELLHTMCKELFDHVFSNEYKEPTPHDIPQGIDPLSFKIHHIFSHLYTNKNEIVKIMKFDSSVIYKQYLRGFLEKLFGDHTKQVSTHIPESFVMKFLSDSFISALEWWVGENMETLPEAAANYYCEMITGIKAP